MAKLKFDWKVPEDNHFVSKTCSVGRFTLEVFSHAYEPAWFFSVEDNGYKPPYEPVLRSAPERSEDAAMRAAEAWYKKHTVPQWR